MALNRFDRISWFCIKCGQANYEWYWDEENMKKVQEIEKLGMDQRNTCINCRYQRNSKTRVPDVE